MERKRLASRNRSIIRKQTVAIRVETPMTTIMVTNMASSSASDMLVETAIPIVNSAAAGAKSGMDRMPR